MTTEQLQTRAVWVRLGLVFTAVIVAAILFIAATNLGSIGHTCGDCGSHSQSGDDALQRILRRNASMRDLHRRAAHRKPTTLIITCIDHRIPMDLIVGDEPADFDVARMPGSILSEEMMETVRLAVRKHHVKLVLVVEHTDCAMIKLSKCSDEPEFVRLQRARRDFDARFTKLGTDPCLAERIKRGELVLALAMIDIETGELTIRKQVGR